MEKDIAIYEIDLITTGIGKLYCKRKSSALNLRKRRLDYIGVMWLISMGNRLMLEHGPGEIWKSLWGKETTGMNKELQKQGMY